MMDYSNILQESIDAANAAFWSTQEMDVRNQLTKLIANLNALQSGLITINIHNDTSTMQEMSELFNKVIMPQITNLNKQIGSIVNVSNELKIGMSKLQSLISIVPL